jgi:hypothetical protein
MNIRSKTATGASSARSFPGILSTTLSIVAGTPRFRKREAAMGRVRVRGRAMKLGFCLAVVAPALVAYGQTPVGFPFTSPYALVAAIAPPPGDKIGSFDISWVDSVRHRYYLANRTSKAAYAVDTATNKIVGKFTPGFAGFAGNNDTAGPDGVLTTETELWVGDYPSRVWALDPNTGTPVVPVISTGGVNRADELCYDPTHKIVAIVNNADSPPFITFISTVSKTVLGKVVFDGVAGRPKATDGAEQCQWNPRDGNIYLAIPEVNGAGDNSSPGAVVVFDPVSRAILRTMSIPLAACTGPSGLTIGPAPQIGLGCAAGVIGGNPAFNEAIINETGAVLASFPTLGGADEAWYDRGSNKYFVAARQAPRGPSLVIIDAATFAVQVLSTGNLSNAHSVAVDPLTHVAYVPTSNAATDHLCSSKGAVDADGCILVYAPQPPTLTAATHDFNFDGKSDILWRDTAGNVGMWLMNGSTAATIAIVGNVATAWNVVGQGDFNGDRRSDILWKDTEGNVAMWLMNGTTITSNVLVSMNVPSSWSIVGKGDFNGDGFTDILWRDTAGNLGIWFMNGSTIASVVSLGNVPTVWTVVGTGDFNGDGMSDILWRDTAGNVAVWLMNGPTITSKTVLGTAPSVWNIVGTGDFNGDGKSDILWRDTAGNLGIWVMNGSTIASIAPLGNVPTVWNVIETGDFNGDGSSDILWRDTAGNLGIWFMNGSTVSSVAPIGNVPNVWTVQNVNVD